MTPAAPDWMTTTAAAELWRALAREGMTPVQAVALAHACAYHGRLVEIHERGQSMPDPDTARLMMDLLKIAAD